MRARVTGIDRARRHLSSVGRATLDLDGMLEDLAGVGMRSARARFDAADYAGTNDVTVRAAKGRPGTWEVVASGTSVLFIEFGSGVTYPHDNPKTLETGFRAQSWSLAKGVRAIKRDGLWIYYGEPGGDASPVAGRPANTWWTRGNPSANAMYEAGKDIRAEVLSAWRRHVRYEGGTE